MELYNKALFFSQIAKTLGFLSRLIILHFLFFLSFFCLALHSSKHAYTTNVSPLTVPRNNRQDTKPLGKDQKPDPDC